MVRGVVKFFKAEQGWGAVSVADLPLGADVWVHFSVIEGAGYRELAAGDEVELELEAAQQDGFRYRATSVRRIAPGPAPTLRRRGDEVRVEPEGTPDTPLLPRTGRPAP